ncbi:MAG: hypothetical protein RR766_08820 [Longicatena sp.]|jgi:PBP1b-binding outer membrane lipoprotein LpoB|uniref:hypothetical protein n=1 Tax=Anaerorhabdus sp. TaxID=1872524 RepID=UPI002FC81730
MKKLIAIVTVALLLAGCSAGGAKKQTLACNQALEGSSMDSNFIFTDGTLTNLEQKTVIAIPEDQKENIDALKTALEQSKEQMATIEGATYEYSVTETEATINVTYDIAKFDDATLLAFGFTDDMKTDGKFDIAKITDTYKNLGIECTVK